MTQNHFLLDVRPRDADAPGYHDLHLDADRLVRGLRGEPCLDRLCRKTGTTRSEALKAFTPGTTSIRSRARSASMPATIPASTRASSKRRSGASSTMR